MNLYFKKNIENKPKKVYLLHKISMYKYLWREACGKVPLDISPAFGSVSIGG